LALLDDRAPPRSRRADPRRRARRPPAHQRGDPRGAPQRAHRRPRLIPSLAARLGGRVPLGALRATRRAIRYNGGMSPVSSATLALLTTLALSTPDSRAHAQACAVSGSGLRMSSVRVAAGPAGFVVHVDPVDVEATPPRAAGARTPIVVRGAVRFEGSVDPSELPYVVREGVEAGGGVLRIGTRLAFDVSSVRASAWPIRATLPDG